MESAEFMASEGNDIFWNYIDEYSRNDAPSPLANDKEQYEFIFKILEEKDLLSQARKNLFKLSLSFRQYNPKVELYRHLVERVTEKNQHECLKKSGWIIFNSQIFCDIKSLEASLGSDSMITEENIESFDHVYPNSKEDSLTVYHYNQLGSASFKELHSQLKNLADKGKIRYVYRHNPPTTDRKVFLQGFGLEMALKSTEYKVIDDRIKTESKEENDSDKPKITPLPKEALETIGVKTVQYIMSHPSPIKALEEVSQNFPYLSNKISLLPLDNAIDEKIKKTHNTLGEGISMILINGRHVNVENIDIFTMLDIIREEIDKSESLKSLKLNPSDASRILNLVTQPKKENIYKIPLQGVHFISDIEVDAKYEKWANSIRVLVQPSFPGQMKFIRKNLLTSFFIFDPASFSSLAMVNEMRGAISQGFPAKFGLLFYADKNSPTYETSKKIAQIFMHIFEGGSQHRAMFFLYKLHELGAGGFTDKVLREAASSSIINAGITEKLIFSSKDYEGSLEKDIEFLASLGLDKKIKLPVLFLNGRLLSAENIPQTLYSNSFVEYNKLSTKFYQGELKEDTNIYEALTENGISKYNVHIQPINSEDMEFISLMPSRTVTPFLKDLVWYSNPETDFVVKKFNYILSFDNFDERSTKQLSNFVDYIIHVFGNTARFSFVCKDCSVDIKKHLYAVGRNFESKNWEFIKEILATSDFESKFEQIATKVGINYADLKKKIESEKNFENSLQLQSNWLRNTIKHKTGEITIVLNGRVERFTPDEDLMSATDIFSLSESESFARTNTLSNIIDTSSFVDVDIDDQTSELRSDLLMQISSMIGVEEVVHKITRNDMYQFETFIEISAKNNSAEFTLVGILNPLSDSAQKFSSIFLHLMEYFNVQWKLTLNPHSKYDDIPLKEFYRFVFVPELRFDKNGNIDQETLVADFENLPEESLFTMNLESSDSLMINAKTAKYDLDNIMLKNVAENTLYALYELRHIIVEGNCYELASGNAPNGLQLVLKSNINGVEEKHDTVVMQNHGYFQLKSNPGVWSLDLAEGKSDEIYEFVNKQQHSIAVNTFNGKIFKLDVNKKPGMQEKQLFEDKKGEDKGIWNSFSNMWGNKKENDSKNETIHIFSVASGHLYERFMSIMMLSVVNSTKSNVKFWIIENFVSPEFKLFVPKLAKEHNFEIQFITYNWPRWLIAQKEKQRKIWAYKILFLDVLFPLDINRIIFVDADQTVRGDIKELWDLDIGGAPYAYVPFCPADSRPETKGFRFWDSGFWAEHLGGKPYHISALYRVDLDTFRRKRSGDFLRSTYNNLSRDKNSLANLDQDLPNYLQHMVPIFSLPQEWLWCETWCSDESKKKAKTIDLCNNPLTKTPKLENALRIVHEWKDYDEYLKNFRQNLQN